MNVETRFRWVSYVALLAIVIARAPTLMEEGQVFDLPLTINVGYLILFGPIIMLLFYVDAYRSAIIAEHIKDRAVGRVFAAVVWMPAAFCLFLVLQYFMLVREHSANCGQFPHELLGWTEFQAVYCIGVGAETQAKMPWLIRPPLLNSALQIASFALSAWLAGRTVVLVRTRVGYQGE